jgi:DNA-binding NtrC family response regulator
VPVSDLCCKYSVSTATYYRLRDQFITGGVQGLQNNGKTNQVKSLELRIKDLEQALGRKTLEVEVLKKNRRFLHSQTSQVDLDYYTALTAELKKDGINIKDAAEILGVPRSRFYPRNRKSNKTPKPKQNFIAAYSGAAEL